MNRSTCNGPARLGLTWLCGGAGDDVAMRSRLRSTSGGTAEESESRGVERRSKPRRTSGGIAEESEERSGFVSTHERSR